MYVVCRHLLSNRTPECLWILLVCGWDPGVGSSCPEPSVDVDGLQVVGVAALALEVALATRGIDGANIVWRRKTYY